jgi:uncharacterized protein YqgV (UPF0045/DUF77 family)
MSRMGRAHATQLLRLRVSTSYEGSRAMIISAQIAMYPLRQERLTPAVRAVSDALTGHALSPSVGPMSTLVTGELDSVVDALREAFVKAAATGHVVMTVTLSNACPVVEPDRS